MTTDRDAAVMGSLDGAVSAVGVIAGAYIANAHSRVIFTAGVGLAVAAAVSMGGSFLLSDEDPAGRTRRAVVMAAATLVGSVLPVVGFLVGRGPGIAVGAVLTVGVGFVVAHMRPGAFWPSVARTFGVLMVATTLSVGAGLAFGAVG